MVKKINMKLNDYSYHRLKHLSDASIDKNLNLLMDMVEKEMPLIPYSDDTHTVTAYEDTYERLDSFRITFGESRDNIITRLLIAYENVEGIQETEIPFKLTSPLNTKLFIEGAITRKEIHIFNKDNSLEFTAWEKLLDWQEIHSLVLEHGNERISFNKTHYRIDINYV